MDFMGVGPPELLVVMVIALLVLGPRRLARTARFAGRKVREMRDLGGEFTRALLDEAEDEPESRKPKG